MLVVQHMPKYINIDKYANKMATCDSQHARRPTMDLYDQYWVHFGEFCEVYLSVGCRTLWRQGMRSFLSLNPDTFQAEHPERGRGTEA